MNTVYKHELCNSWDDYRRCPAPIHTNNMVECGAISGHSLHYSNSLAPFLQRLVQKDTLLNTGNLGETRVSIY